jgi:hypothetical protein
LTSQRLEATTIAGPNGERMSTANELAIARFQGVTWLGSQ